MSKEKKGSTIQLRFPEFKNKEGWILRRLSDVLVEHDLRSEGSEEVFSVSVHKGVVNQIEHLGRSFSAASTSHYKRVLPGDVIYTKSPTGDFPYGIIKQSKVKKPVIVSPLYGVFTPETTALGRILDAYFESKANTHNYLASIIQKGAKNTINITNDTFLSKSLYLPSDKEEQHKIADCLSSLEELMAAQSSKLEALKAHKKGLMQALFPAQGETVPRLRFPEFRENGEWREKKLGQLIEIKGRIGYRGYTVEDIVGKEQGAVSLSPSNFDGNGSLNFENSTYISWDKYEESPEIKLKEGFTVLVKTGSSYGKTALVKSLKEKVTINPQIVVLKPKEINAQFLFLLVSNYSIQEQIKSAVVGGAIPTLSQESISKFDVLIPPDKEKKEQQKIASCLSSLDALITTQTERLEALKQHKRGLMQGLFPQVNGGKDA